MGKIILADRGYDSTNLRAKMKAAGGGPVIPGKQGRKTLVFYIPEIGGRRRVVANFFARLKGTGRPIRAMTG